MDGKLTDQRSIAAATMYCQIRASSYSKVFAVIGAGFVGGLVTVAIALTLLSQNQAVLVSIIVISLWSVLSIRLYQKQDRRLTWPELNSLKGALYLPSEQYAYLDCIQAIDESRTILGPDKIEWVDRLNATLTFVLSNKGPNRQAAETLFKARDTLIKHGQIDSELERMKNELIKPE